MSLVKTAAIRHPEISKYLEYVGIRAKAVSASDLGIDDYDTAIYFPSLDGNSYPGITYSEVPSAQFQPFKLHVFPKDTLKRYFMNALAKHRTGKINMPQEILKPILAIVSDGSGRTNSQVFNMVSRIITEAINQNLNAISELGRYGVSALPETAIKSALNKNEAVLPALVNAVYLRNTKDMDDLVFKAAHTEVPKHILETGRDAIFKYISKSFDRQSKHVIAQVISRVTRVSPQFQIYLSSALAKKYPPTQASQGGQERYAALSPELQSYFQRADDESLADACKDALVGYLNEIYREGLKDGGLGLFGKKEQAKSIEISKITQIVNAVNSSAPVIDIDIPSMVTVDDESGPSASSRVVEVLKSKPEGELEGAIGSSIDFGYNIDALKTLINTMIDNVPEFSKMFGQENAPGDMAYPAISKKGDKINIVSFTQSTPTQYNDWVAKIQTDLNNPRVIQQLEMMKE